MRAFAVISAVCCACYAPAPKPGSPCVEDRDCPRTLRCALATSTCEHTDMFPDSAAATSDAPLVDGCTPTREVCGNGIDEDCDAQDPACAPNDVAAGAVDVTAGGTFTGDALLANDDVTTGCGDSGGRDLFYQVDLGAPQVYYFDTFGSSFDTVIRVFTKPCSMVGTGANPAACVDDACGGSKGHVAVALPSGRSCIVIDQKSEAELGGNVTLRVVKGGRDAKPLAAGVQTNTGDTCSATNTIDALDQNCDSPGDGGKDHAFFFTSCPGQTLRLDADTCPEPMWDPTLHVRRHSDNAQIGCNDDDCGFGPRITNVTISGGTLYYLFVDGFDDTECGPYSLDTNLRP
jgi:hypothetical protein